MSGNLSEFNRLSDAEEYFQFFELPYDQKFVNINRLHILKKFSQYIKQIDETSPNLSAEDKLSQYCEALQKAYQVFIESTPQQEKLFKVFNDKQKNVVKLTEITSD